MQMSILTRRFLIQVQYLVMPLHRSISHVLLQCSAKNIVTFVGQLCITLTCIHTERLLTQSWRLAYLMYLIWRYVIALSETNEISHCNYSSSLYGPRNFDIVDLCAVVVWLASLNLGSLAGEGRRGGCGVGVKESTDFICIRSKSSECISNARDSKTFSISAKLALIRNFAVGAFPLVPIWYFTNSVCCGLL
jgi:hypothetical protein